MKAGSLLSIVSVVLLLNALVTTLNAFQIPTASTSTINNRNIAIQRQSSFDNDLNQQITKLYKSVGTGTSTTLLARISKQRRNELGINDDEDEYDLDKALENNTDPLITKIIAGSFIITMIILLVVGLVIPFSGIMTSESTEGLCNPILNGGRC